MKDSLMAGLLLAVITLSCQQDELTVTHQTHFQAGITELPDQAQLYDTLELSIAEPVVAASWHDETGRAHLYTASSPVIELLEATQIGFPLSASGTSTRLQYVPTSQGIHQGYLAVENLLSQRDTLRYRVEVIRQMPDFNARVFSRRLYLRQQSSPSPPLSRYTLTLQGSNDLEALIAVEGVKGEYRLGDDITIPYSLFEQYHYELPYAISFLDSPQDTETINFVFTDEQDRTLSFQETFLLAPAAEPVFLPDFNARLLSADSLGMPKASFLLYLRQQGEEAAPQAVYTIQLEPNSGLEVTYTVNNGVKTYRIGDICQISYEDFIANEYILPIKVMATEGRGKTYQLSWKVTDPGGRSLTIKNAYAP